MTKQTVRRHTGTAAAIVALAAFAFPLAAQDAGEILDRMLTLHEQRVAGIDNYAVVQSVMGFETVSYFVKEERDGRTVFRLENNQAAGANVGSDAPPTSVNDIFGMGAELREKARYVGRETIDGAEVHVLEIAELDGSELGQAMQGSDFTPERGRLYLDTELSVPRRMEFEGQLVDENGVTHQVSSTMEMRDYRDHEGLLLAHRTVITIDGLGGLIDDEARAQFEEMERELAKMPPEQRKMVEAMMSEQIEQFRQMMSGDDGGMVIEIEVRDVRINEGR